MCWLKMYCKTDFSSCGPSAYLIFCVMISDMAYLEQAVNSVTFNNLVDIVRLVTSLFQQVW